ncbi:MAG: Asr1405/Asl0597 family protein [Cyanobacteria bacterium P01_F01_bin.3]
MPSSTPTSSAPNPSNFDSASSHSGVVAESEGYISITCDDRWEVYHRLQSLDFDCQCSGFQPLTVSLKTPTEAVQLWSILRRVSQPKLVLADSLNRCWRTSTES